MDLTFLRSIFERIYLYIKNTMFCVCVFGVFVCLSRINWKDYESQEAENLYPGVILYCDNDLLVFEGNIRIFTLKGDKIYVTRVSSRRMRRASRRVILRENLSRRAKIERCSHRRNTN